MKKIYVHHIYSKLLFNKLAHNTINRVFDFKNNIINCELNSIKYQFIFNEELNDNDDGIHIIDYFTMQNKNPNTKDYEIMRQIYEKIKNKTGWVITIFKTDKILNDFDNVTGVNIIKLENVLNLFSNHFIISDNMFLNNSVKSKYPNFYYAFTNTIFEWNNHCGIRWYFEYKNIFDKLNFDYDLCYSVRNYKDNRILILNGLKKLNHNILTIRTDSFKNDLYYKNLNSVNDIALNSIYGNTDFEDISILNTIQTRVGIDLFFRILPTAKMQILDESWAWVKTDFNSQYLSEKTFGLILSGIPFISTHTYPLDMLSKVLDIEPHPFYNLSVNGEPIKFISFVNTFMENFDYNYSLCKKWSLNANDKMLKLINTQNSLLEIISNGLSKSDFINLI